MENVQARVVSRNRANQNEWWCSKTTMGWLSLALTVVVIGALVTYFSIFYDSSNGASPLPSVDTNGRESSSLIKSSFKITGIELVQFKSDPSLTDLVKAT
eukprot:498483_1